MCPAYLLGANTDGLHAIRKISSRSKARAQGALGPMGFADLGGRPLLHDLPFALSNLVKRACYGPAYTYAACGTGSRYAPPRAISTQTMRAILLAKATAAILVVRRCRSLSSQGRRVP
jgi:hypothetical protein